VSIGSSGSTNGRLRVALLIESDGPGGAESVVHRIVNGLTERGHEALPFTLAPGQGWLSGRLRNEGYPVHQPSLSRAVDPAFARRLSAWSRQERIDVLHAHEFTMGFYAGAAGLMSRIPHIITMHGGVSFAAAARRRWALKWSASRAASTVGVSESTCQHLSTALGISRRAIELVPNGVHQVQGNRSAARESLGVSDAERLLLSVGNLYPVKGHATLIAACALLAERTDVPSWRLCIAGRGDEESSLREQIRRAGLEGRVTLLGLRNDVGDLLAAADGWIMPSLSEGLPMALLEAMSARLPIIASAVGGIPDVLGPTSSGHLVPVGDATQLAAAMEQLLRDPAGSTAMGDRAYEVVESSYSASAMVDRYVALYRKALA